MRKVMFMFCLFFFPITFTYSHSKTDSACNSNTENIFKVYDLKIKYETVQYIYEQRHKFKDVICKDCWNSYFELIRGYPFFEEKKDSVPEISSGESVIVTVERISDEEMDSYIEQLNCTPEQALHEYKKLIRTIKAEKAAYLKCIDVEIAKGDLSKYAKDFITPYGFMPAGWSLMPRPEQLSKLDFLKVFKEFILKNNENVLPEGQRVVRYLSGRTDADMKDI